MKTRLPLSTVGWGLLACGATALSGHAQQDDITIDRNRIWISARFAFNISAEIRNLSPAPPPASGIYDDGFVLPDASGSADGKTWYWGYQHDSQISGDALTLHVGSGSPRTGFTEELSGDIQAGFEIDYGRALGFFDLSETRQAAWGVLGGFGSLDINLDSQNSLSGSISRRTDQYSLGGITPPGAPYAGTYDGPGPVIAATPLTSATAQVDAVSTQYSRIDALALAFKLGPFLELPISSRFAVNLSVGLAAVDVLTTFQFQETLALAGDAAPPPVREGDIDESEWLIGFYGSANLSYAINYNLSVFAGVQYQSLGDVTVGGEGKEAVLKMGQVLEVQLGLRASF